MEFGVAIERNHLPPDSIIWYFPKYSTVFAYKDTFFSSIHEFPILVELIFDDNVYTKYCETSKSMCYVLNLRLFIGKDMMMVGTILSTLLTTKSVVIVTFSRCILAYSRWKCCCSAEFGYP